MNLFMLNMLDLQNKTATEKAKIKSQELAKVKIGKYTKSGFDIKIIGDIKEIEINGSHGIEFFATAYKNGKQLGFGKDGTIEIERFRIFNPPVLVDDPNGEIIREWTDEITQELKQRKLKYDPAQAIKNSLAHTIGLVAKDGKDIIKGKVGNTTSTFYPAAGVGGTTSDGYIRRDEVNETFTTIRGGAGTSLNNTSTLIPLLSASATTNQFDILIRAGMTFNTAVIDTDAISSAVLSLWGIQDHSNNLGSTDGHIVDFDPTDAGTFVAGDFTNFSYVSFASKSYADFTLDQYNDFTLNAGGKANINKTGVSGFGWILGWDLNNSFGGSWVSGAETWMRAYAADQTGTANDPKLVVVHSAVSTFIPQIICS